MDAREPKEVEDPRTAIFVKGTHTGETLNATMKELVRSLKLSSPSSLNYDIDGPQTAARDLVFEKERD